MSQLKVGALLSYIILMVSVFISILYTPIVIRQLGKAEYGLYSLIGSIAAYLNIMDMGLSNTIVRFVSRSRVMGNEEEERKLNGLFFLFYSIIGAITLLIGFIIIKNLDPIFESSLTSSELSKAKIMVLVLTITFSVSFPLSVFGSLVQAYEKFVVLKVVSLIRVISIPIITLPFLFNGYASLSMVIISSSMNIISLLILAYYCLFKLKTKVSLSKINSSVLKSILGYSSLVFLGVLVDQIYWKTDQFILGSLSGTKTVAVYAVAMIFINLYIQFSTAMSGLFLPRVSKLVAENVSTNVLTNLMVKFGRVQFTLIGLVLSGFILFGREFITYWAGDDYKEAYIIVVLIMVPLSIPLIQNIGISILYAKSQQGFRSIVLLLMAVINVLISIPLAKNYAGIGTAFATVFSLTLGNILAMNIYYHKKIGLNMVLFWKNIFSFAMPLIVLLGATKILGLWINYSSNISFLIFKVVIYVILYFLMFWIISFNMSEKKLIKTFILKVLSAINHKLKRRDKSNGFKY
ncbi:oligosaccharide flippase family protein [Rossellomorea marisflavi]|uniref:oligosaccharide flippase family protein n=1 Tax=Rossellomorea marisflavi TaxID=189381 RepID=UPI003459E5CE